MIKAIFFDVDGTLIPHGSDRIYPSALKALKELKKKGIKLFVATGRPPNSISHVTSQFDFDGYLTANGQYCFNSEGVIHEQYIPKESIQQLLPYVKENKVPILLSRLDTCFRNEHNTDFNSHWPLYDENKIINDPIVQIMAPIKPEQDEEFLAHLPGCKSARWTDAFADIIPIHGGKNYGITHIANHYHIKLEEIMAIGDGGNDITMLLHVPYGVAMGNAKDEVKKYADFVTTDILDDGIVNAFKHYGLLEEDY